MDCSLPCSSVHGILQARKLEWVVHTSAAACGLRSFSSQAREHRLSSFNAWLSDSTACGIFFPNQESNPCLLHWQAYSQPPGKHPILIFIILFISQVILTWSKNSVLWVFVKSHCHIWFNSWNEKSKHRSHVFPSPTSFLIKPVLLNSSFCATGWSLK